MAYKRPESSVNSDINVTPLVDVILVLLIIFMVITPMLQKGMAVNLAPTQNARAMHGADKTDAIIVAVSHDGHVYLGNSQISLDSLTDQVKSQTQNRVDKTVYVKADERAQFTNVSDVIDAIRAAGISKVALLTEQNAAQTPGGPPIGG